MAFLSFTASDNLHLTNLLQPFDIRNQKVGQVLNNKQVLLYMFCSRPETGFCVQLSIALAALWAGACAKG